MIFCRKWCLQAHHTLAMYNLAMLYLARDAASCQIALELLKRVAGMLSPFSQLVALRAS